MQSGKIVLNDKVTSLEEIASRIMANGHSEEFARNCAETLSVVSRYALEEPITRGYVHVQIELFENRSKRYWSECMEELLSRLDRLEEKMGAVES